MKIGMNLPVMAPGVSRNALHAWCRGIDAGPYSTLAIGERITFPNPEVMVTASTAAALTERVRIAFTVIVLPMHRELLIAKQVATLDVLSGGRVDLGLGVGARAEDYRAVDAAFDARRLGRMERQIARMRRAWAGELVVDEALRPIEPLPLQAGGPPLWAGSLFPQSIRRAARWAVGICGFSFGPSAPEVEMAWQSARTAWSEEGRAQPPRLATSFFFAIGPKAREQLDTFLARYLNFFGEDAARTMAKTARVDSPERLKNALRMLADLGTDEVWLVPTTWEVDELHRVSEVVNR